MTFLFGICAFSAVSIGSGTLFKIAKYITDYGASLSTVVKVFVFGLPNVIMWTFPMSMLLATLLTFGRLSSSSEITAMKSCGVWTPACLVIADAIRPGSSRGRVGGWGCSGLVRVPVIRCRLGIQGRGRRDPEDAAWQ